MTGLQDWAYGVVDVVSEWVERLRSRFAPRPRGGPRPRQEVNIVHGDVFVTLLCAEPVIQRQIVRLNGDMACAPLGEGKPADAFGIAMEAAPVGEPVTVMVLHPGQ